MPQYYFDVFDGGAVVRDAYGDVFASLGDAADQAVAVLADVAWDNLQNGRGRDFAVAVRNDERDVYHAALIFRDGYPDPRSLPDLQDVCPAYSGADPIDLIRRSRETRAGAERLVRRVSDAAAGLRDVLQQTSRNLTLARTTLAGMA